jgi:hypothetical protein
MSVLNERPAEVAKHLYSAVNSCNVVQHKNCAETLFTLQQTVENKLRLGQGTAKTENGIRQTAEQASCSEK